MFLSHSSVGIKTYVFFVISWVFMLNVIEEERFFSIFLASFISVQLLSYVWLFVAPWTEGRQASMSFAISWSLFKFMSSESVMSSNQLVLCHPLLLLPSICPSSRVFSSELALRIKWPKYWKVRFSISPSNEYSGLISFTIDWFDLLAVQGTLKSPFQHHSLKASILQHSAFLIVWLSHPYITTGKTLLWLCGPWSAK